VKAARNTIMPKQSKKKSKGKKKKEKKTTTDGGSGGLSQNREEDVSGNNDFPILEMMMNSMSDALQNIQSNNGNVGEMSASNSNDTGDDNEGGAADKMIDMMQSMMGDMMENCVAFKPDSKCRHGHKIPTIDCEVGMLCISGYENALNMSADSRFKWHTTGLEPQYTSPDEDAVTSPSPLWHKKILHLMRVW